MDNVSDIRNKLFERFSSGEFIEDKTGCKLIELIGSTFLADEDFIFGEPSKKYILQELQWYKTQSCNINAMSGQIPKIWQEVSGANGEINSNYGWCIWSKENGLQYASAKHALLRDINTRRAIMIYNRPSMQQEYNNWGMDDFMCTNSVQYFIRNNVFGYRNVKFLDCVVNMRSNDVVFGYRNDWAWQRYILETLCKDLNQTLEEPIHLGKIIWQAGSLHIYERHFGEFNQIQPQKELS
tara:strand:+ start:2726 stop:3442 length:717 start_codon:yes stop_codon:yes gene_type:complete